MKKNILFALLLLSQVSQAGDYTIYECISRSDRSCHGKIEFENGRPPSWTQWGSCSSEDLLILETVELNAFYRLDGAEDFGNQKFQLVVPLNIHYQKNANGVVSLNFYEDNLMKRSEEFFCEFKNSEEEQE